MGRGKIGFDLDFIHEVTQRKGLKYAHLFFHRGHSDQRKIKNPTRIFC
jgi:hypothetical protein